MDVVKIRNELNDIGFSIISFSEKIKNIIEDYITFYLFEVISGKNKNSKFVKNEFNYETSCRNILEMTDEDFVANFSKPFRMFPENISQIIVDWIKQEMREILGVSRADSSYVSTAERKINKKLHEKSYDIFWRCVRINKNDVGPAHRDHQFWDLYKNTENDVPVPFSYKKRWKLWVPILGCTQDNMLQVVPYSHKENIPIGVTETPFGRRPCLSAEWLSENEHRFVSPIKNIENDCVIFHDHLVHRGQKNISTSLRISSEFTILVS